MEKKSFDNMDPVSFENYEFTRKIKPFKQLDDNVTRRQFSPAVVVEKDELTPLDFETPSHKFSRKSVKGGGNNYLFINVSNPLGWSQVLPDAYGHQLMSGNVSDFPLSSYFANSNRRSHILLFLFLFCVTCAFILVYSLYDSSYYYSYLV
uniref:Uncharacterized protein n=1 Tax=Octopus bimaculoides TaxID=37653 RepID=A0A0L8HZI3_OCTBM